MKPMVFALFALLAFCPARAADVSERLTGILLVARAELPDSSFRDSVVFVTNQSKVGPVGLIVNKPTPTPISELFPAIENLAQLDDKVYFGGPFSPDLVSFLFRAETKPAQLGVMEVFAGVYFSSNHDLLVELLRRDKPMAGLRIFRGHARWEPAQAAPERPQQPAQPRHRMDRVRRLAEERVQRPRQQQRQHQAELRVAEIRGHQSSMPRCAGTPASK